VPLPVGKILTTLPQLVAAKNASPEAAFCFARAIMTTDTRPKLASARFRRGARTATVLGIAKGAGMIHPNMATMLAFVFTDIAASTGDLQSLLRAASDRTFNCISVDGDTSTNDTVLLMASGASGLSLTSAAARKSFQAALSSVCQSLAEQIVADGEGVSHVVRLRVEQARNQSEANQIARAIARSLLVKTAWAGADPNWGRILAAVGASGVGVDPAGISIWIGDHQVCRRGGACDFDRAAVHDYLAQPSYSVQVRLGRGPARTDFLTCDLTAEYVRINAEYST
jgi:glutamate N-acetyltransferase/amino-acid N-acetyltransferase